MLNESWIQKLVVWELNCVGYNYELEKYLADHLLEANAALEKSRMEQRSKRY